MSTRIRKFKEHPCHRCGETITNSRCDFCDECWPKYIELRDLYRVARRGPVLTKTCPVCGKTFYTKRSVKTYCSEECQYEVERIVAVDRSARLRKGIPGRQEFTCTCLECGNEFKAKSVNARFCSDTCNKKYHENTHRCAKCGKEISTRIGYCEECRQSVLHTRKLNRAEATLTRRRAKASKWVDDAMPQCRPVSENSCLKDHMEFSGIGVYRIDEHHCVCLRCGKNFVVSLCKGGTRPILVNRLARNESPCPSCGINPRGSHLYSTPEVELAKLYPNFTERNIHPDWMQGLELDLYDPVAKVALEFHGLKWHSDASNTAPSAHKRKADLCEKAGVQLIQLYESEWVQRREQVIDKLDAIFHKDMTRYYARKLELRTLNDAKGHNTVNRFMDANHIQGHSGCQWAVGLFDGDEPLAICTFKYGTAYASGGQAAGTDKYWELNRYATKLHTSVVGGISRCVKAFMREHPDVHTLVSFADRRWTCPSRSAYSSSGFIETGRADPNYMYTDLDPATPLRNKQYMRKAAIERRALANPVGHEASIFSWNKTELDMATELGWYRIYDAGKIRYEMTLA